MAIDTHELVNKLIGPIDPVGEQHIDDKRLENLEAMTLLVDRLVESLHDIHYNHKDSQLMSEKRAADHVHKFLTNLGIENE